MAGPRARGQSVAEYAVVFGVVIAAVVGMQIYVKRGLQGKMRDATDFVGARLGQSAGLATTTAQYEPYYAQSNFAVDQSSKVTDTVNVGGSVGRNVQDDTTKRTGLSTQGVDLGQDDAWR